MNNTIKTLELFGGIGSPRKALERTLKSLKLNTTIKNIDYVEWWGYAVEAYNKLFDSREIPQNVIGWNLNVDILIHGSPCTRFSNASSSFYKNNDLFMFANEYGATENHLIEEYENYFIKNNLELTKEHIQVFKREFEKFMRTSGLYFETLRIIEKELTPKPKVVIWENVKGLLNKTNIESFNHYLDTMESFGYTNHYKVLNSKDFGIPQSRNRVFVVSILKGQDTFNNNFDFEKLELTPMKKLKEFLEPHDKISKDYYITAKSMISAVEKGKIKIVDNYVETIIGAQQKWNSNGFVKVSLHLKPFNSTDFVHNPETSSMHTLDTNSANNRIAVPIIVVESKDFSNFKTLPRASDGELINGTHNRYWKEDKYIGTLTASADTKIIVEAIKPIPDVPIWIIDDKPYHLRVLTQREAWRLMGWEDIDIDQVINMPKTHLYKMAGNAIVIQVLESIFKELLRV